MTDQNDTRNIDDVAPGLLGAGDHDVWQAVQAYGQPQPLAAGMQLEADVLLDRRRLIEWIFEPLLSVTGRV